MANDRYLGPTVLAVMIVESVICLPFVAGRCYTRHQKGFFGWDDWMVIIGWIILLGFTLGMCVCVGQGYGHRYTTFTDPDQYTRVVKTEIIAQTFAVVAFIPIKAAVAGTILRIFPGKNYRTLHIFLWFSIISTTIIFAVNAILDFAQCDHPEHVWNPTVPAKCWDPKVYTNYSIFTGAWGGAFDFVLSAIPWYYITKLQMTRREQIGIATALSLGVFAGACAIVKTIQLRSLSSRTDYAYDTIGLILWCSTEECLLLIAACIPTLRPLLVRFGKAFGSNLLKSRSKEYQQNEDIEFTSGNKSGIKRTIEIRHASHPQMPSRSDSEEAILAEHGLSMNRPSKVF